MSVDDLIAKLNKSFGPGTIGTPKDLNRNTVERVSTGIPFLDWAVGGGWPKGRFIELYGPEGGGKTFIALNAVREVQKDGGKVLIVDMEHSLTPEWMEAIGVNVDDVLISQPDSGNQAFDIFEAAVREKDIKLVVFDSLAAASSQSELDASMEKEQMGVNARMTNKGIRKIHQALAKYSDGEVQDTIGILINQVRMKIGTFYGSPETTPGGMGVRFGASLRLNVRRSGYWEEEILPKKKVVVGQSVGFKVVKSKVCEPYRSGVFTFMTQDFHGLKMGQVYREQNFVDLAIALGKIVQSGPYYAFGGKKHKGRQALYDHISSSDGLAELEGVLYGTDGLAEEKVEGESTENDSGRGRDETSEEVEGTQDD